jgi:lipopolysaccharide export system protein LptA
MKTILLLLIAGSCGLAWAQTNLPAQKPLEQEVGVHSDHFYFDGKARQLVYYDDVVATNWEGTLTCERLTIKLPPEGSADNHPTEIDAETNVVVDFTKNGETNHVTSDKAIYAYSVVNAVTNVTITFTGHAKAENAKGWMTGEPLVWDNVASRFTGTDFKMIYRPGPNSGNGPFGLNLNSASARTTAPLATNSPGMDTDFPPGKLDLVPEHRAAPLNH